MAPRKKEEVEEQQSATDEEVAALIKAASDKVAKKLNYGMAPIATLPKEQEQEKESTEFEGEQGEEEEDDTEAVNTRGRSKESEYKMHEILSYLQDRRYMPGNSRLGADMILPAAMNLAISHYLEDDTVDLLEEFFHIFFLAMRSLQSSAFDKTMDLGKAMLHSQFENSEQSLHF